MRISVLIFACLIVWLSSFSQQTHTVNGKISDSKDGTPLPGVTVKGKGQTNVVLSKQDGTFTITVPADTKSLQFSYVGYAEQEVDISQNMTVKMFTSERSLNEVVVVGYGRAVKRNITGSISKLTPKDVENFPAPSFESAIQGKAPGVVVESGSGKVGQAIKIRIRGTSSISASSQPLYVVDGLPIVSASLSDAVDYDPTNPLADINPNDIESIEVLKDASASAIYGARAANGVVLITTKKGRNNQKTTFELNLSKGYSNPARKRSFLNASQYVNLFNQAIVSDATYDFNNDFSGYATLEEAINDYRDVVYPTYGIDLNYYALGTDWQNAEVNTDWQDLLFTKNAQTNQVDLSAYGGDAKTKFFVSGFYNTQEAIVINNKFYRYGGRLNLEHNASDKLTLGINISVDRSQLDKVTNDNSFSTPGQLVAQLPISPLYDPVTGKLNGQTLYPNGIFDAQFSHDKQVTNRTLGNVFANYSFFPALSFRSEFGADILDLNEDQFLGKETTDGSSVNGSGSFLSSQSTSFNTNNYFTYTPSLNEKNKLNVVLGMSYLQNDNRGSSAEGEQYPSDAIKNLSGATSITAANSTNTRYTFLSYFLRGNYSFKDKYLVGGSIRTDGSSRFGPDNRYGWFPSISAGWLLSEENFLKNISFLNFLKLRASWGLTGNAEIGESNFLSLYNVSNYPGLPGFVPGQLGDPNLKWEKTAQTDIGLEFGIIKGRISGEVDVYKKHTTDLLLQINIPATTGYKTILKNLGTMDNKGIEVSLNSNNLVGKFKWSTALNFAYNKNEVVDIKGQIIEAGFTVIQRAVEGEPIGVFYGQKFLGVDPETGDALYLGEDGKPTSNFENAKRVVLGKAYPEWTGGFTNTFSYAGFDLSAFFYFVQGNKVNNAGGYFMSGGFYYGFDNQTTDILNAWQKPGDKTDVPRIGYFYGSGFQETASRWLYDGSYIRLRNVTFGYTLPKSVAKTLRIQSARVYVMGVNLWTVTDYPGDPEVNSLTLGNIDNGQDFYTIPQPKTITIGVNVKF
jgi:TonB-linked SusC/RagA family outer membrane protein